MSFTDETLDNTEMTLPAEVSGGVHDTMTPPNSMYVLVHQIVSTKQASAPYGLMLVVGSTSTVCAVLKS